MKKLGDPAPPPSRRTRKRLPAAATAVLIFTAIFDWLLSGLKAFFELEKAAAESGLIRWLLLLPPIHIPIAVLALAILFLFTNSSPSDIANKFPKEVAGFFEAAVNTAKAWLYRKHMHPQQAVARIERHRYADLWEDVELFAYDDEELAQRLRLPKSLFNFLRTNRNVVPSDDVLSQLVSLLPVNRDFMTKGLRYTAEVSRRRLEEHSKRGTAAGFTVPHGATAIQIRTLAERVDRTRRQSLASKQRNSRSGNDA